MGKVGIRDIGYPEIYHISLAGVVIIECALRKNSHRLLLKYIERDGTRTYFTLLAQLAEQRIFNPWGLGSSPRGRTIEPTAFLVFNRLSFLLIFMFTCSSVRIFLVGSIMG